MKQILRLEKNFTCIIIVAIFTSNVYAAETGNYKPPNLNGYTLNSNGQVDIDKNGINETHFKQYNNSTGDSIARLKTNNIVWLWSLDTNGDDDSDIIKNYNIIDTDGDGKYDTRTSVDAYIGFPDYFKYE